MTDSMPVWSSLDTELERRIAASAVDLFAEHGYFATRTREITSRAGFSPSALYVAFESKHHLLFVISKLAHEDILSTLIAALSKFDTPDARMRGLVASVVEWHARNSTVAAVAQTELRGLTAEHFRLIAGVRQQIETLVRQEIERGVEAEYFRLRTDPAMTARIILSMAVDVSRWYSSRSKESPAQIAEVYAAMVHDMLRAPADS